MTACWTLTFSSASTDDFCGAVSQFSCMMQGKAEANHLNGFLIYELKYFFCEVTSVKCVHIAFYYLTQNVCKIA